MTWLLLARIQWHHGDIAQVSMSELHQLVRRDIAKGMEIPLGHVERVGTCLSVAQDRDNNAPVVAAPLRPPHHDVVVAKVDTMHFEPLRTTYSTHPWSLP